MTDEQSPDQDRPRPQYGEYAPQGWQPPARPEPPTPAPAAPTGPRLPFSGVFTDTFRTAWQARSGVYLVVALVALISAWVNEAVSRPLLAGSDELVMNTTNQEELLREVLDEVSALILPALATAAVTGIVAAIVITRRRHRALQEPHDGV